MNYQRAKITKIIFILPSISQPRCIKRVKGLMSHGFDAEIYGYDRGKYNVNVDAKGIDINIIGKDTDGRNYIKKIFNNYWCIRKIFTAHNCENNLFYSFGFIQTLLLKVLGCRRYIYEISDIIYGYRKWHLVVWLLKSIDIYLVYKSMLTIVTSEGFATYLFKNKTPQNVLVQRNKIDPSFWSAQRPEGKTPDCSNQLVFSYIGAFRCPDTVFRFARIIGQKYPNHKFYFFGDSHLTPEVKRLASVYDNVKYYGPFRSPGDLTDIYNKIQIIVACYDDKDLNERIVEPNKLYESLYFQKPIIVSRYTYLERRVKQFGCGYSIDASNDSNIINFLDNLSLDNIKEVHKAIRAIELDEIIDDGGKQICSMIRSTGI